MKRTPTGPTPEDIEEYGTIDKWDDFDEELVFDASIAVARVEFTREQIQRLTLASDMVEENSIHFIKNAAIARINQLLGDDEHRPATPAAGGS